MDDQKASPLSMRAAQEITWLAAFATCIKVLLIPSYRSTDFEVHRNWLAVTRLPISQWYVNDVSEWTLDYPPFFAWFERALSFPAGWLDPVMVDVHKGLNYSSTSTVLFLRFSVIISDLLYYFGIWYYCRKMEDKRRQVLMFSLVFCPGLMLVDHIHFQYNGVLFGLLLLSLALLKEGEDWKAGMVFCVLICFKHLFAIASPFYFVYLLRHYCIGKHAIRKFFFLGFSVLSVFALAFGPFVYLQQILPLLSRLFPFGRGLCHAYWAPNFWPLYISADKVMAKVLRAAGGRGIEEKSGMTRGLVGDFTPFSVLPSITPARSAFLVLMSMLPCFVSVWRKPEPSKVAWCVGHVYLCGFFFGFHIHEKACLQFLIPLTLAAIGSSQTSKRTFLFLSAVSNYSLFPLLFELPEYPIKLLILILYLYAMSFLLSNLNKEESHSFHDIGNGKENVKGSHSLNGRPKSPWKRLFTVFSSPYLWGLVFVELYASFLHKLIFKDRLPFFPLLLISVYCSFGICFVFIDHIFNLNFGIG